MSSLSFLATTCASPLHHPKSLRCPSPAIRTRRFYTSCDSNNKNNSTNATNTSSEKSLKVDRRNVLLGLGGLYGATTLAGGPHPAVGAPVGLPDLSKCHVAHAGTGAEDVQCCPPEFYSSTPIVDYKFPDNKKPLRIRQPAHLLGREDIEKYKLAVAKMRELSLKDPNDPRGWMQQANVHCQYCNGAYDQLVLGQDGKPVPIQVHFTWFFLPWHRWYLHFYERILGSLIGDDSFALPFWNWDTPDGMYTPSIFLDPNSSLYDDKRNLNNYPPTVMDLSYSLGNSTSLPEQEVINKNLLWLNRVYKESLPLPELFAGDPLRAGELTESDANLSSGQMEIIHNGVHQFVGQVDAPNLDMGNFFSAGRDPVFYCHHSNVDRMWHIYRSLRGNKVEFKDPDWLNSTFLFADENKQLVRVKLGDCLNPLKLKFTYEEVELPWQEIGLRTKLTKAKAKPRSLSMIPVTEFGTEPKMLDKQPIRVLVTRPKKSRSKTDKESAVETLTISGIQAPIKEPSKFDVYVTTVYGDDLVSSDLGELAGSFVRLPHHSSGKDSGAVPIKKTKLKLGINNLIEDIGAEEATKVVVSLVPRLGKFTVGGVTIDLLNTGS